MDKGNGWINWREVPTKIVADIVSAIVLAIIWTTVHYAADHRDDALSLWRRTQTKVAAVLASDPEVERRFAAMLEERWYRRDTGGDLTVGYPRTAATFATYLTP